MNETRVCVKHGEVVFNKRGNRFRCSKCATEAVTKRRRKIKQLAIEHLGGCCTICGYNKYQGALEFHHLDPTKKDFVISLKGHCRSWIEIKKELDKCILLCSNCHREVHAGVA